MNGKFIFIALLSITLFCLPVISCTQQNKQADEMTSFGPNNPTSLVIFFNKGTSHEEIQAFWRNTVSIEKYNLAIIFQVRKDDHEGVALSFSTKSTHEQREELKRNVKQSPIVYKTYENVATSQINDL